MPIVDIEKLELEFKHKEDARNTIKSKIIGDKHVYQGPHLRDWYDDAGECFKANQNAGRAAEYKHLGLDEYGRTKAQARLVEAQAVLSKKRDLVLEQVKAINEEIASLKIEDFEEADQAKKGKESNASHDHKKHGR